MKCREQIFEEIRKREETERELVLVESEKLRWREGFKNLGN